jgi:hypothetical protein
MDFEYYEPNKPSIARDFFGTQKGELPNVGISRSQSAKIADIAWPDVDFAQMLAYKTPSRKSLPKTTQSAWD